MVEESTAAQQLSRYAPYVEELKEFLGSRGVASGSPAALAAFLDRLQQPDDFGEEVASLLRAFFYAEDERLGRVEMMRLVAVAVGGPAIEAALEDRPGTLRPLLDFVSATLRSPRFGAPDLGDALVSPDEDLAEEPTIAAQIAEDPVSEPLVADAAAEVPEASSGQRQRPLAREDIYLRAQELAGDSGSTEHLNAKAPQPAGNGSPLPPAHHSGPEAPSVPDRQREPSGFQEQPQDAGAGKPARSRPDRTSTTPRGGEEFRVDEPQRGSTQLGPSWMIPGLAVGLAVLGVGAFLARPGGIHPPSLRNAGPAAAPVTAGNACIAPMSGTTSRTALEERERWAHRLLDQKLYDAALPEFQEIARLDPGFPGVSLEESDALLHLQRLDEAQAAADTQIGLADCLARLPSTSLDRYCSTHYASGGEGCRPQLVKLRDAAQLQSELVHLAIDHWNGAVPSQERPSAVAKHNRRQKTPEVQHTPLPPASDDDHDPPPPVTDNGGSSLP